MSNNHPDFMTESQVERRLNELKDVPVRDPMKAASGRARFLSQAAHYRQTISPGARERQNKWIIPLQKEKLAMNAFVTLVLAVTLLLGGGATVAAAQDDLPTQPLYQLKLWTEDATLAMNGDPQERASLLMNMAQNRVQEMAALADMGITPPNQVRERLEQHLDQTLQLAAGMDEATREELLLQLHDRLQTQNHVVERLQTHKNSESEPVLTQTRQLLQTQLQLVDKGLADPQGFRYLMQNQKQRGPDEEVAPGGNQQGVPGSGQNGQGAGNGNGNDPPGGPNPDRPQNGNNGKGPDNNSGGGPNQDGSQGGNGPGSENNGGGNRGGRN